MFSDKFNLGGLMKNAKKIQEMMEKAQHELEKIEVTGESGGGAVKVTMTAQHYIKEILIEDELLKEDKIILQDLIAGAINNATQKVESVTKAKMANAGQLLSGTFSENDNGDDA